MTTTKKCEICGEPAEECIPLCHTHARQVRRRLSQREKVDKWIRNSRDRAARDASRDLRTMHEQEYEALLSVRLDERGVSNDPAILIPERVWKRVHKFLGIHA